MIFQLVTILFINITTAQKTIFSFSKCSEKMVFPKKLHWNMIFLVLSGKMIFLFPQNIILFFRRKMKDDLSQKNTWKYDIFFKCSEKMVFPKKSHWNMIFLVLSGKMIFLFPENMIFFFNIPHKNTRKSHWNMIFLVRSGKMIFFFNRKYDIFSLDGK